MSAECKCKDENGRCIASDIVADYAVENKNLKIDLKRAEEQVRMLEDGLQEYANRITGGEFERIQEELRGQSVVINKVYVVLQQNKKDAKKKALGILNAYMLYNKVE